ncbi:hypothetical protein BGZ96_012066 [Linnemannia gamsii]|uniref:Uncharacterized protein n=1 Tax=Linnemannia gamsii TaxID=64522 RepID=A0ABQ7KBK2_9FUNG|nr:hypothetical protein BGZ96_012066 [Linnemannia gamsii]
MFLCCAPSLRTLCYEMTENDDYWSYGVTDESRERKPGQLHSWEIYGDEEDEDEEEELRMLISRQQQEPMNSLTSLKVWSNSEREVTEDELRDMLALCPNLTNSVFSPIYPVQNPQQLAQDIAQRLCPKLTTLEKLQFSGYSVNWELTFRILEGLPEQQVQIFHYLEWSFFMPGVYIDDIGSIFQRQSRTLRELRLVGCQNINSKVMQVILVECVALEQLEVQFRTELEPNQQYLCIELEDAVEFPWGCTRIWDLDLTIAIPDEPFHHLANGEIPYYDRPSPILLSAAETAQFQSLEAFYRQLGTITELKCMDLKATQRDLAQCLLRFGVTRFRGCCILERKR